MTEPLATEKQIAFIKTLLAERAGGEETKAMIAAGSVETTSRKQASAWITWLLAQEKLPKEAKTYVDPPEGMHSHGGQLVKVYKTRNGYLASKVLIQTHGGKWAFDYRGRSGLKGLSETTVMSEEEAKLFGKTYNICVNCAADLTDERSIFAGYGPVCAKNHGWWYPTMSEALAGLELGEKGEGMTKLTELVSELVELAEAEVVAAGPGRAKWEFEDGIYHVEDYEGYSIDISPAKPSGWGVGLTWGTWADPRELELPGVYPTLGAAKAGVIKFIDDEVAEIVKSEKELEKALAELDGEDEAAMFDAPPIPTLDGKPHLILSGAGPTMSVGSPPTVPGRYEVEIITIDHSDEISDEDSDEPEFIEIPLESLLLRDDL